MLPQQPSPEALDEERARWDLPPLRWRDTVSRAVEAVEAGRADAADVVFLLGRVTRWLAGYEAVLQQVTSERNQARRDVDVFTRLVRELTRRDE